MQGSFVQADDVLDLIDSQSVALPSVFEGDGGFVFSKGQGFLSEEGSQIDEGKNLSSNIDQSAYGVVRAWHWGKFFDIDDISDLLHRCCKKLLVDVKSHMLLAVEGRCGCKGVCCDSALREQVLCDIGHRCKPPVSFSSELRDGVKRLCGDHCVKHGNGEEGVGARKEHCPPCAAGFELG